VRRRVLRWSAGIAAGVLATLLVAGYLFLPGPTTIRHRVERTLGDYFDANVTFRELHVSVFPHLKVEGAGLTLTPRARQDAPPLIAVSRFSASAAWSEVFVRPRRIRRLEIEGLRITIPPDTEDDGTRSHEAGGCQGTRLKSEEASARGRRANTGVVIALFTAPDTVITLLPRNPAKLPRVFAVHELTVHHLTLDRPLQFDAVLTNPTPRGLITTRGQFGPWVTDAPGLAAVKGTFEYAHADLNTIDGIGGTLSSKGSYDGVLQQILVHGETETPDFSLDTSAQAMPLTTTYDACVDGTDGDTYLDRVDATLASTKILAKGRVEGAVGVHGRTVALDVSIDEGRIEDLLRLAVKGDPPLMRGAFTMTTRFLLPPGPSDVVTRLQLEGRFGLERTRFTGKTVQEKIDQFSRMGRGKPRAEPSNVASNLSGRFALKDGVLRLSTLRFAIPGARVELHGSYGLVSERIAFRGTAKLQAKLSQMTTGFKSLLLKMVDPLFKGKDAGTVVPIHIEGTREHPKFGVDLKKAILH
jgi:hypothetical protein